MSVELQVNRDEIQGEVALGVPPGTTAAARDRLLDEQLTDALFEVAQRLGVVMAADPHDFARPLDGRDEQGRTRFAVRGRVEGDRLVPVGRGRRRRPG
jgi:hypothetical protein